MRRSDAPRSGVREQSGLLDIGTSPAVERGLIATLDIAGRRHAADPEMSLNTGWLGASSMNLSTGSSRLASKNGAVTRTSRQ